jgi:ATP-dependent DNA helicase RecG
MAGILLFGKDETILSVLPYHRTDLILRRDNTDRYDDRDFVDTNLIESYDRIISFGQKHLPDPFYLEGTQRVSIRDKVIREIASNILIHREYAKSYPAKIIIERARIVAENGNRVLSDGIIDPDNFTPNPKNPVLARFFKEIGLADELGSGVRNLFRYSPIFAGSRPVLFEDDVFRVIIPLANMKNPEEYSSTAGQVPGKYRASTGQADRTGDIRAFCRIPKSSKEIMTHLGLTHRDHFRSEILNPLLEKGLLARTIPEKPNSPKQKYISRL